MEKRRRLDLGQLWSRSSVLVPWPSGRSRRLWGCLLPVNWPRLPAVPGLMRAAGTAERNLFLLQERDRGKIHTILSTSSSFLGGKACKSPLLLLLLRIVLVSCYCSVIVSCSGVWRLWFCFAFSSWWGEMATFWLMWSSFIHLSELFRSALSTLSAGRDHLGNCKASWCLNLTQDFRASRGGA